MERDIDEKHVKMHSYEYMLKEIEEKMVDVQNALSVCEAEMSLLTKNITSIKQSVDETFKRHIGTLQCRAKWLVCHVDSIFHLKEGSLSQQVAELELISNELKNCLDASDSTLNKSEKIKSMAQTVLESVSNISLQPCESGSMSFVAHNDKMEVAIIGFGDIDAHDHSSEYDLLSDEGILVIESPVEKQDFIEMEIKSIEMHHLTAQSAKNEKEDFERIEIELQSVSGYTSLDSRAVPSQVCQGDLAFEEGANSGESSIEWLHRTGVTEQVVPEKLWTGFHVRDDIKLEKESSDVTNCADEVPLWLKACEESSSWIRRLNSTPNETISKNEELSVTLSKESHLLDNNNGSSIRPQKRKEDYTNMDHMNSIFFAPSSKFLRIEIEALNNSFCSLNSAVNSLTLVENNETVLELPASHSESFIEPVNVGDVNEILGTSNSIFLRDDTVGVDSNSMYLLNPNLRSLENEQDIECSSAMRQSIAHINGILNSPVKESLLNQGSDSQVEFFTDMHVSAMQSNIAHINRIFDSPAKEFLVIQDLSNDCQILSTSFIKSTNAVNHMRDLESRPDEMFLRSDNKIKAIDPELCEWLRGSASIDHCMQCFDLNKCEFNGKFDNK